MVPPLRKAEEDKKKLTNKHIIIGKMYTYKITYKSTGDYFKMADASLHLSLQHYTMLPPLRKAEEDTVLRYFFRNFHLMYVHSFWHRKPNVLKIVSFNFFE